MVISVEAKLSIIPRPNHTPELSSNRYPYCSYRSPHPSKVSLTRNSSHHGSLRLAYSPSLIPITILAKAPGLSVSSIQYNESSLPSRCGSGAAVNRHAIEIYSSSSYVCIRTRSIQTTATPLPNEHQFIINRLHRIGGAGPAPKPTSCLISRISRAASCSRDTFKASIFAISWPICINKHSGGTQVPRTSQTHVQARERERDRGYEATNFHNHRRPNQSTSGKQQH